MLKGRSVEFNNASGYIWVVLPQGSNPIVKMNGFEISGQAEDILTINDVVYDVWKSDSLFNGTMSIYLF